ncbi:maleylpyruvate isomerase N-terminal domain-containing protein [Streptomyces sp. NPDC060030]|uniref:maleylpyruvate isomerase N-terminal domain-containing protein n=1 Tax=Streptomyces sp. NPDC060030 TaxID=3347042 RepID=UPI0036D004DB
MTDSTPVVDAGRDAGGIWPLIRAERAALAADLSSLSDDQWEAPSLCSELTVREVLAHLTAGASLDPVRWMAGVIRCRFDFDRQVALRLAERLTGRNARAVPERRAEHDEAAPPGRGHARRGDRALGGHPASSGDPPGLSDRHGHAGRRPLPGLGPRGSREETYPWAAARRVRRPLQGRCRTTRLRHHHGTGHGHDRSCRLPR